MGMWLWLWYAIVFWFVFLGVLTLIRPDWSDALHERLGARTGKVRRWHGLLYLGAAAFIYFNAIREIFG